MGIVGTNLAIRHATASAGPVALTDLPFRLRDPAPGVPPKPRSGAERGRREWRTVSCETILTALAGHAAQGGTTIL